MGSLNLISPVTRMGLESGVRPSIPVGKVNELRMSASENNRHSGC